MSGVWFLFPAHVGEIQPLHGGTPVLERKKYSCLGADRNEPEISQRLGIVGSKDKAVTV